MLQLALLAALLMAFAPSLTRWMASDGTQLLAGWTELCTTEGTQWVDTRAQSPVEKSPAPAGMPMGADCAYCTLAAAVPLLLLAIALLLPRLRAAGVMPIGGPARFEIAYLRGLGGQGPPVLL